MATMNFLTPVEYSEQRILTTEQLAEFYECNADNIKVNFNANKEHFTEGKHYFKLDGDALRKFKESLVSDAYLPINKFAPSIMLWTKQGAARHAKMLTTEKAWEVFEELEENYFNANQKNYVESQPVREPLTFSAILRDVDAAKDLIQKIYAVKDGIATAQATNMVGKFYGQDLSPLKALIPPAEHETGYMNATQLGEKVGMTARAINQLLKEKGLQFKDGRDWRLTEKGKQFGEELPYDTGKHSGYQIRWGSPAAELFLEDVKH